MQIFTVLKSGPEYRPEHLYLLADSIIKHNPHANIICLTDMAISHPAVTAVHKASLYPKWWGKLQLFGLAKAGPALYMDIDTVCVGDLSGLFRKSPGFTMLPNVYHRGKVGSGVMSWFGDFSYLLRKFERMPACFMEEYTTTDKWGDQAFIARFLREVPELFGPECLSYKAQIRNRLTELPNQTKLVYFHGRPRPWQVPNLPW